MPNKTGVTIGISYQGSKVNPLKGTIGDSLNMTRTLTDKFGYNIINLNDQSYQQGNSRYPSKANIIFWLNKLLREANDGDELFIGYAGHGVQLQASASNTEELDGRDEAIIPADYDFTDKSALIDDEIQNILATQLRSKPNCKVFMLFDCCHSGTGADLRYTFNYHDAKKDFTLLDNKVANSFQSHVVMISGCRDDQVSWEELISLSGGAQSRQGVMTSAFLHVISTNPASLSNVFDIVKQMYRYTSSYKQQPQISSNYDLSKSQNSNVRRIINFDSNTAAVKPTATNPTSTKPTSTKPAATKPTSTKPAATKPTVTKPTVTKPSIKQTTNKSRSLSSYLDIYANTNRYRYEYKYLMNDKSKNRSRSVQRSSNIPTNAKPALELGSSSHVSYVDKELGVRIRSGSGIPNMSSIIGMTV